MPVPNPDIPNIPNTPEVGIPLSFGPARPVVLFPVRLETRFFPQADGSAELRVRVYPDKVHIDSHEPELTADEVTWGQHFWEQTWRAGNDEARAKAAWRQLADRFDAPRAAWIARALQPLNPGDRPANAVAAKQPLPKPIRFPSPATQAEAWMRAPETRVLPNFWVVLGYKHGRLVVNVKGGVIPAPLATGPDPSPSADADQVGIDQGMKWMVDFDAAETVGMGIRATLASADAAAGLDFVLVMGIKDAPGGTTDWTPRLAELFDAHHYTDGLSFVPPGTPSNNTQDAPSGFRSTDPGHEASYLAERIAPGFQPGDRSNADVLTTAFGLANAGPVFANLPNATTYEQLDARHMNTALWQATWGYFLLQILGVGLSPGENPLTDDDIAWARSHFIEYVRAGGPLPAVRIGKQPYGILPVTSLSAWQQPAGQQSEYTRDVTLRNFLLRLRDLWRRNSLHIPRLGHSDDIAQDLAEVLSMEGLSSRYSIRNLIGRHYLQHLWVFLSADRILNLPPGWPEELGSQNFGLWFNQQSALTTPLSERLGVTWQPRLARAVFAPPVVTLRGALVQADHSASLSPNYIASLLATRDLNAIGAETVQQPPPRTLLYLLLRHSMLLEYAAAASRLLINRGLLPPELRREPELVDLQEGQPTLTVWKQMAIPISVMSGTGEAVQMPVGQYLLGPDTPSGEPDVAREPDLKPLSEFRASLAHLQLLNVARLEQLLTGTLDICSHRLDAWITSFATKRLTEMRQADLRQEEPIGVLFGGYGWVMNLTPAAARTPVTPPPPGEPEPVFEVATNPGFVHTPSLTHAATAAILRSGHLTHAGQQNDLLAIDLSSERVRLATWLLDGVRQGQPLGALLGYRLERRLQEGGGSHLIARFRELWPLVAKKLEQTDEAVEAIAANNVVDGLALSRLWQEVVSTGEVDPVAQLNSLFDGRIPPLNGFPLVTELNRLADAVDAVSDALMAESVYQVVRGNPLRAASTVESIAGGETPPPELEVVRTPRTGVALTHRLATLFSGEPVPPPPGWPLRTYSHRANAEPHLNAWAAKLLGNPVNVRCVIERLDPATGHVIEAKELPLNQFPHAPLDLIYAVEGGPGGQQAEIEQRVLYTMMRKQDGFPPGSLLRINPDRKPEWQGNELSYGEFSELLRTVRKLITSARAIGADDLNPPERSVDFSVDVDELEDRARVAEGYLRRSENRLGRSLGRPDTVNLGFLKGLLWPAASFGVAGAIPLSAEGNTPADRQTLLAQAGSVHKELAQRVKELEWLAAGFHADTAEGRCDYALAQLRIIFGKAFVVLPRFRAANAVELEQALADSTKLQDGDPFAATTWFQRMARVRDGVARLSDALSYAEALGTGEHLQLTLAQLPYNSNDRWVGLPLKDGQTLPGGKLSLAVQSATPVDVHQPLAGLLIDEWVDVVPSAQETTGIALQYDQPNAAPPQTILVAVPPELESPWTVWSLQQVLLETLDLARIRAVDPDALGEVGHYLPALYFACNTADKTVTPTSDTVSTDFTTIK